MPYVISIFTTTYVKNTLSQKGVASLKIERGFLRGEKRCGGVEVSLQLTQHNPIQAKNLMECYFARTHLFSIFGKFKGVKSSKEHENLGQQNQKPCL